MNKLLEILETVMIFTVSIALSLIILTLVINYIIPIVILPSPVQAWLLLCIVILSIYLVGMKLLYTWEKPNKGITLNDLKQKKTKSRSSKSLFGGLKGKKVVTDKSKLKGRITELLQQSQQVYQSVLDIPDSLFEKSEIKIESRAEIEAKAERILGVLKRNKIDLSYASYEANASLVRILFVGSDKYNEEGELVSTFDPKSVERYINAIRSALGEVNLTYHDIIQGKPGYVAFEIRNPHNNTIRMGNIIEAIPKKEQGLPFVLGQKTDGKYYVSDITDHPHTLIVGTTGSGKSIFVNTMIIQLLLTKTPNELELWISDNKTVEFSLYAEMPHTKYFVDTYEATNDMIGDLINELNRRNRLFTNVRGAKDIDTYNKRAEPKNRIPYILLVIDEFPTLSEEDQRTKGNPLINNLTVLLSKGRSSGIYVNIISQYAKAAVLPTTIRGNISSRIALKLADSTEANTAEMKGADQLNGNGDMLVRINSNESTRVQGAYINDTEIDNVIDYINNLYKI